MTPQTTTLKNGLRIITAEMPGSYSCTVSVLAGVGSRYEDFNVNGGVSHFLEHLLFKGSVKRPSAKAISEAVDGVGGLNNAYTANDLTNYYIKLPKKHFGLALDILADMVQAPLFDAEELDRERGVIVEEMNVYRDDPARYIHDLIPALIWPNDPMGQEIIGSEAVINRVPRQLVVSYQQMHYSPDNLVVSVAGNVKHERVVSEVEKLFGNMPKVRRPKPASLKVGLSGDLVRSFVKDTNQAHLLIGAEGYPYNHPRDAAATVLTQLLGAGMSSRLFINVRERLGLAYSVYTNYHNFVDTGLFEAYAGVNLDKIELALGAVWNELNKLRQEPVSDEELTKVKNMLSGTLQMSMENTFNIADRFGTRLLLLNQVKTVDEVIADIEAVTSEAIQAAAQEMLAPDKLRLAVIAPDPSGVAEKFTNLVKD